MQNIFSHLLHSYSSGLQLLHSANCFQVVVGCYLKLIGHMGRRECEPVTMLHSLWSSCAALASPKDERERAGRQGWGTAICQIPTHSLGSTEQPLDGDRQKQHRTKETFWGCSYITRERFSLLSSSMAVAPTKHWIQHQAHWSACSSRSQDCTVTILNALEE